MPSDKQKFGQGWKGPYLVVEKIGDLNYRVKENEGSRVVTLHVDHIKLCDHDTPESWLVSTTKDIGVQTESG